MSSRVQFGGESVDWKMAFGSFAQMVLSLDSCIEWVVLEEASHEPRWAWRDAQTGGIRVGTINNPPFVDPLLLMIAESRDDAYAEETFADPHRLLFVVLAYADFVQIVVRFGISTHVSIAAPPGSNSYDLGRKLTTLLDRYTQGSLVH